MTRLYVTRRDERKEVKEVDAKWRRKRLSRNHAAGPRAVSEIIVF